MSFNKIYKKIMILCISFFIYFTYSETYNSQQMLSADHWIYDAIFNLNLEAGKTSLLDTAPLSIQEIRLNFDEIDYETLSETGKKVYKNVQNFLDEKKITLDLNPVKFGANLILYPELLYKSNDEIDWTFGTDYTGHKTINYTTGQNQNEKLEYETCEYGAASNWDGNQLTEPFAAMPFYMIFNDFAIVESDFCLRKSFWGMTKNGNFTNIAYDFSDFDFLWPIKAYGSAGYLFDNGLGVNFSINKQGYQYGRSLTGSVIINDTFQTDGIFTLDLYSKSFKYNMSVMEISNSKIMYLHSFEAVPFKSGIIRIATMEGAMINGPFEIRFLNPLMIMHSFGYWTQYRDETEYKYYNEAHCCAYMGINFDIIPCKNLRLYGFFAQTEVQPSQELKTEYGRTLPNGLGFQGGVESSFPVFDGYLSFGLEGVYTTPFLYIKNNGDWSLYKERNNMQSNFSTPICSWIGSPFGPDCIGGEARISFKNYSRWSANLTYVFAAHGTNSFGLFSQNYTNADGKFSAYFPSVLKNLGLISQEKAEDIARTYALTGTVQYTNQIGLSGDFTLNGHFKLDTSFVYSFIYNNKNIQDDFQQGVQMFFGCEYKLF